MSIESSRQHGDTPSALPIGTRLGEFELLSLLGVGGFGIVYLAFDHALEREVAVKEYMPASLAGRTQTLHVSLRSQSDAETFALGLKSFVNEARLLARFDHPSLLKVLRFWEGNGTAYMAMPVMRGHTLKEIRLDMTGSPDEAWTRALLEPLLGAIERLHSEGVYHRDIAPDNIQIEPDGRPVLLDFGAARRVISDKSQTLTAILKPAYAPIEQYAEVGSVKQGPWTDIYALGATLHFLLLARPPAPATARAVHDDASALTQQALPGYSENFLHIVDWMLAPRPVDRPQNVAMLRDALEGRIDPPHRRSAETPSHWDRTVALTPTHTARPANDAVDDQATRVMPQPVATGGRALPPAFGSGGATGGRPGSASQGGRMGGAAGVGAAGARTAAFAAPATGFDPDFDRSPAPPPFATTPGPTAAPAAVPGATAAAAPAKSKLIPVLAGVAVLAVAAIAAVMWPRQQPAPVAVADPAPLATPSSALKSAVTAPPPTVPESTVATVVLPRTPGAVPTQSGVVQPGLTQPGMTQPGMAQAGATQSAAPAAATAANNRSAPLPGARPANERLAGNSSTRTSGANATAGAMAPAVAPTTAATYPSTPAPASAPVQTPAPAGAGTAAPAPEPAKPVAVAAGPETTCGAKNPLSYFVCMERTCLKSEFSNHSDCLKWHKDARAARRE